MQLIKYLVKLLYVIVMRTEFDNPKNDSREDVDDLKNEGEPPLDFPQIGKDKPLLYYPDAIYTGAGMHRGRYYKKGYPEGAVIHFHAGRNNPKNLKNYLKKKGYGVIIIDREGKVWQDSSLDQWQPHAGTSRWGDLKSLNSKFVGIEVMSSGMLKRKGDKYHTWFKKEIPKEEVRYAAHNANIAAGYYHTFTQAQEETLIRLLLWLHKNNPSIFKIQNVCGHDECGMPLGRKTDPGGSLSMPMPELRNILREMV